MEDQLKGPARVDIVGDFKPSPYRNGGHVKGVKPASLKL